MIIRSCEWIKTHLMPSNMVSSSEDEAVKAIVSLFNNICEFHAKCQSATIDCPMVTGAQLEACLTATIRARVATTWGRCVAWQSVFWA